MLYRVTHATRYSYSEPVSICHNQIHLLPRPLPHQVAHSVELHITPEPAYRGSRQDYFGNEVIYFSIHEPHAELEVVAVHELEIRPPHLIDPGATVAWDRLTSDLRARRDADNIDALQFAFPSPYIPYLPQVGDWAAGRFTPGTPVLQTAVELINQIHNEFRFDPATTTVATPLGEVLNHKSGVCQDFAHLAIAALRHFGVPARYVSGYLRTYPPEGKPRMVGADASHAWISVYCGNGIWADLDPTNNCQPAIEHLTVAWGRDFGDVSPIKGVILGGGQHTLGVSVDVLPLDEDDTSESATLF